MGVMDKFLNAMKLNDDDDDYYDDDYYDEEPVESKPKKLPSITKESNAEIEDEKPAPKKVTPKVTPMRQNKKTGNGMEVCVIKPTSIEDAREITETLLANRTVVLNLEGLDVDIASLMESTLWIMVTLSTIYFTLLVCRCPIICQWISFGITSYLSTSSCTLFSPNSRQPS